MAANLKRDHRVLDTPFLTFNLPELIGRLKKEDVWKRSDRNPMTLTQRQNLFLAANRNFWTRLLSWVVLRFFVVDLPPGQKP